MILKHLYNMEKNDLFKIRAELAGMALQGLLANPNTVKQFENNESYKEIGNITENLTENHTVE